MVRHANFWGQAEACRDLAWRARRLAAQMTRDADRLRLIRHAQQLEEQADSLDRATAPSVSGDFDAAASPASD